MRAQGGPPVSGTGHQVGFDSHRLDERRGISPGDRTATCPDLWGGVDSYKVYVLGSIPSRGTNGLAAPSSLTRGCHNPSLVHWLVLSPDKRGNAVRFRGGGPKTGRSICVTIRRTRMLGSIPSLPDHLSGGSSVVERVKTAGHLSSVDFYRSSNGQGRCLISD